MGMHVLFGVKASNIFNIDDAAAMVARIINATPMKWNSEARGDYCTFDTGTTERAELVPGIWWDYEDGDYPVEPDFPNWKFLLYLAGTSAQSPWLKALEGAAEHFEKLHTEVIPDPAPRPAD